METAGLLKAPCFSWE